MASKKSAKSSKGFSPRVIIYALMLMFVTTASGGYIADRMGYQLPGEYRQPIVNALSSTGDWANGTLNSISTMSEGESSPLSTSEPTHHYAGEPRVLRSGHQLKILENTGYVLAYDEITQNPLWVAYRVDKVDEIVSNKRPKRFYTDSRTDARVTHNHYTRTGFDRGHMAPNYAIDTRYGNEAQRETFLMSNIVPQKPNLNRRIWMRLEQAVAKDYAQRYGEIWVITGPIYFQQPETLDSGVAIPDAFFKILIDDRKGKPTVQAYIMTQHVSGSESFDEMLTTVDEIERVTGLDFMSDLPDHVEDQAESNLPIQAWPSTFNNN